MPQDTPDYFELFDLAPAFSIDKAALEKKYRKLQALLHPDRHAAASGPQKRAALRHSAQVNEAYGVLVDDCARAACLLRLQGVELDEERDTTKDAAFLAEQMELRERLHDAGEHADAGEARQLLSQTAAQAAETRDGFERAWRDEDTDAAREWLLKMKFVAKLDAETNAVIGRLETGG